jgi:hypothetical protein
MDNSDKYILAEGPDKLGQVLDDLLEKSKADPAFATQDHFVLYQLGSQKSLMKVDTSQRPFQIWYFDMMGRPETVVIKDTITRFLWDRCGGRELYSDEFDDEYD